MNGCLLVNNKPEDRVLSIIKIERVKEHRVLYNDERTQVIQIACNELGIILVNHYGPHKGTEGGVHYKNLIEVLRGVECQGKFVLGGDHNTVTTSVDRSSRRMDPNSSHVTVSVSARFLLRSGITRNSLFDDDGVDGMYELCCKRAPN